MGKRMTATEKWDKEWFMTLSPRLKCLWMYINDKCDQAGMWQINLSLASMQIGEKITKEDFKSFGDRVEIFGPDKIWIVSHVDFQCGTLSTKSPAHKPVFKLLQKYTLLDRVLSRLPSSLQEKEIEKEKEREEEKEKDKETESELLENYEQWTQMIMDGNDQYFEQMFMKEMIPAGDHIQHWILDHRDLLNRYPKMRPPTQDAFRKSCIKHIRENYKKPINGTGTNGKGKTGITAEGTRDRLNSYT